MTDKREPSVESLIRHWDGMFKDGLGKCKKCDAIRSILAAHPCLKAENERLKDLMRSTSPFRDDVGPRGFHDVEEFYPPEPTPEEKAEAELADLREAIEAEAARRAYAAGLGASEWRAFLWPEAEAALAAKPEAAKEGE